MANTGMVDPLVFDIAEDEEEADISQALKDMVALLCELPGGTARNAVAIQLSGDAFAPVASQCHHLIDSQGASGADDLVNITASGVRDGFVIFISIANAARPITVKNSGNIVTLNALDLVIGSTKLDIPFRWDANAVKWRQLSAPELVAKFDLIPGALPSTELTIASNSVTPIRGFHTIKASSGTADTLNLAAQTTITQDTSILMLKAKAGHTISVPHQAVGTGNFKNTSGATETLTGDRVLVYAKNGTQWDQIGSHGFTASTLMMSGGRFTASSTEAVAPDLQSQTTGYLLPFGDHGDRISLYDGAAWNVKTFTNPSEPFPNYSFCPFLAFAYDNAGTVDVEYQHNGASQVTKTISGATAAASCVITTSTSHGLSVGDLVAITGIVGNMGTDSKIGLNSTATSTRLFKVTATPTGTTFTLGGITTTGKTYTSGGTVYVVGSIPTFSYQDGIPVKTGDATRRLIGAGVTGFTAGQCHSTGDERFVASRLNPVNKVGAPSVMSNSHTYNSTTPRLMDLDITKRKQWVSIHPYLKSYARLRGTGVNGASSIAFWNLSWDSVDNSGADSGLNAYGNASLNGGNTFTTLEDQIVGAGVGIHSVCVNESCTAASNSTFVSNEVQVTVWW